MKNKTVIEMKIKVCIIGYGRMGQAIESYLNSYKCTAHYIIKTNESWDIKRLKECDVAIEFSTPQSAYNNITMCLQHQVPIVSGTTGWLEQLSTIKENLVVNTTPFLYGSNFSLGMNLFFRINTYCAKLIEVESTYNLSMEEIHHVKKLDKPSGTAITLANDIIDIRADKTEWVNQSTIKENEIGIDSIRLPDVPGTHTIKYENESDIITLTHEAKSRKGFAVGAILAAKWLIGKNGYYTISDYVDDLLSKKA